MPATLPKRPLGKTGTEITLLDIGTGRGRGVGRLLRYAYAQGIRAFDTSAAYQSEPDFKAWFQQEPAVRKELFIVTKEHEAPEIASQLRAHDRRALRGDGHRLYRSLLRPQLR